MKRAARAPSKVSPMMVLIELVSAHPNLPNHHEVSIRGMPVPAIIPRGISDQLKAQLIQRYVQLSLQHRGAPSSEENALAAPPKKENVDGGSNVIWCVRCPRRLLDRTCDKYLCGKVDGT
jgi:hypothetical protein